MNISTQSQTRSRWQHPQEPPGPVRYFNHSFGMRRQEARILGLPARGVERPRLLAVHGAGGDYTQLNPLLYGLQHRGVASLGVNLAGHSEAAGLAAGQASLELNVQETMRFAQRLRPALLAMVAADVGTMVALRVAQVHVQSVHRLVLIDPCLYPDDAFIRPLSLVLECPPLRWQQSSLLGFLQGFMGEVMVITGRPPAMSLPSRRGQGMLALSTADAILRCVKPRRAKRVVLEGCPGPVVPWLHDHPEVADRLAGSVQEFLHPI